MRLLDIDELGLLLKRSPATIRKDMRRNPFAVPQRLHIPGTRLLRWRECDVLAWLEEATVRTGATVASARSRKEAQLGQDE